MKYNKSKIDMVNCGTCWNIGQCCQGTLFANGHKNIGFDTFSVLTNWCSTETSHSVRNQIH